MYTVSKSMPLLVVEVMILMFWWLSYYCSQDHRGLSSELLKFKKIFKNLILIKIHLWEPSENNADKFQ
jgi:hypothetical protein